MKIGLLSPHYAFNYGAVLQAFALKTFLRSIGHDAIIINRRPEYQCAIPSRLGRIARKLEEFSKRKSFGYFEKNYLQPQTEVIVHQSDWSKIGQSDFDVVIVGSDQVWRDDYVFNSFGYNLFLDFVPDNICKISYAPSLGKENWTAAPAIEDKVRKLLCRFDHISVREESSIAILKNKFDVDATLVLDPTMLLEAAEYRSHLKIPQSEKVRYIAGYILDMDENYRNKLKEISQRLNLPIRNIGVISPKGKIKVLIERFKPMKNVIEWVKNIANADFVVTNSFHGMVFSIIFRKQFIVFMNKERGAARFKSLLDMFGLKNRLSDIHNPNYLKIISSPINYDDIEPKIESWRKISFEYLKNALSR